MNDNNLLKAFYSKESDMSLTVLAIVHLVPHRKAVN